MPSRTLVVGGGRVGTALAALLLEGGHDVTVLDDRPAALARLRERFGPADVHEGGMTDPGALESAGIRRMDVVAAVTAADEQNLVITCLARYHFGVPRTVARIVDPAKAWMYTPEMGVDAALNQADLIAHVVAEEMSLGEMTTLLKLRRGQYALVEERVHLDAPANGSRLDDLTLPDGCVVVAVLRGEHMLLRGAGVTLQADDEVLAVCHTAAAPELAALLGPGPAGPGAPGGSAAEAGRAEPGELR
jgi:trk system potassium uptake protein